MDRLSPPTAFLHVEDGVTHMHIGSCAIFEGPPPPYQDFTDLVAVAAAPAPLPSTRYGAPGQLGRPVWVDDPHFKPRLPRPPLGATTARRRGRVVQPDGSADGGGARSASPLWEADDRRARRYPMGTDLQGPPLHGLTGSPART